MGYGRSEKLKKLTLAILEDEAYSKRFADYVSHRKNIFAEVMIFTSASSIADYVTNRVIDTLLVDAVMADSVPKSKNIRKILILSDGECVRENNDYPVIFKYQSADLIFKEVSEHISEDDSIQAVAGVHNVKNIDIYGVYSPSGEDISLYALDMAEKIAQSKRTLYINLEIISVVKGLCQNDICYDDYSKRGMSEVIFYVKQRKNKLALKIESLVYEMNGYDCIFPVENYRDFYSMTVDDMRFFLDTLLKETPYEAVIFEIGYLTQTTLFLMEYCNSIILPQAKNHMQEIKNASFLELLAKEGMEKIRSVLRYI